MADRTVPAAAYSFDAGRLGHVEGLALLSEQSEPGLLYFGGLPYALPPVGPFRFRKPRPLPQDYCYGTKSRPGQFTKQAAVCPQPAVLSRDDTLWNEDCLQLNIYMPVGCAPENGWPVYFWIHGGFLQWGSPNTEPHTLVDLFTQSSWDIIIVMPAYRLNLFGFLSSPVLEAEAYRNNEPAGNMGFWDQRLALEWTAKNIRCFGGDPNQITVGGFSAGGYSTFHQLAYDLYNGPAGQGIIKQAVMISNSPGVQPKRAIDNKKQFEDLLLALNIPLNASSEEQLARLRAMSVHELIDVQDENQWSGFRATTDGIFVSQNLIANINSGDFARRMKTRGVRLMTSECKDEHTVYRLWRTPESDFESVRNRLSADYINSVVEKLCEVYCGPQHRLPDYSEDWQDMFGRLFSNMQVHCLSRGFNNALSKQGLQAGKDLFRYRIEWRASGIAYPEEWGVTHGTDLSIWFFAGLTEREKDLIRPLNQAISSFVKRGKICWGTNDIAQYKLLDKDGKVTIRGDSRWKEGVYLWNVLNGEPTPIETSNSKL